MKHLDSKLKRANRNSSEKEQALNNNFAPLVLIYIVQKRICYDFWK